MNYNNEMKKIIDSLSIKPKLLLHSCCGPCSTAVIERLKDYFDLTIYYYNPNIEPFEEYEKRKIEQIKVIKINGNIDFIDGDYENNLFHQKVIGLEQEIEGGKRCIKCFQLRLEKTRNKALENNYDYFSTTLTVSPYKNAQIINEIGVSLEQKELKYLVSDFKKEEGYKKSIQLSKEYKLYRQEYCGCFFSKTKIGVK